MRAPLLLALAIHPLWTSSAAIVINSFECSITGSADRDTTDSSLPDSYTSTTSDLPPTGTALLAVDTPGAKTNGDIYFTKYLGPTQFGVPTGHFDIAFDRSITSETLGETLHARATGTAEITISFSIDTVHQFSLSRSSTSPSNARFLLELDGSGTAIWDSTSAFSTILSLDPGNYTLSIAGSVEAVSDSVVDPLYNDGQTQSESYTFTNVPEPSSSLLALAALGTLFRRRRN